MSGCRVLCIGAALAIAGCIGTAQASVTNVFGNLKKVMPDGQLTGVSDTQNRTFSDPGFASITDLRVTLTIANGYNGDFYAYQVHDKGLSVLMNRVSRTPANSFGYRDAGIDLTLSASGNGIHEHQAFSPPTDGDEVTDTSAPDALNVDLGTGLNTDTQTALLDSFNGTDPKGAWTLFLADLDFGQQGSLVKWGVIVSAIPEPSTLALSVLGGLALGMRFLWCRRCR